MGGGLLQLVAYGAQDIYLTGNPQITFFKVVYRRYTNFAIETIEQPFVGTITFGNRITARIPRSGDLAYKMYLKVVLGQVNPSSSQFAWTRRIGHAIISQIDVEIGGTILDRQFGTWLDIWYELAKQGDHDVGYANMIGDIPILTNYDTTIKPSYPLYIPLQFWFNRFVGLSVPLIALQYHVMNINVVFDAAINLVIRDQNFDMNLVTIQDTTILVDYVFLDTDERRRFALVGHEYLIEQIQFNGVETANVTPRNYVLDFHHPVKELFFATKNGNYVSSQTFLYYTNNKVWSVVDGSIVIIQKSIEFNDPTIIVGGTWTPVFPSESSTVGTWNIKNQSALTVYVNATSLSIGTYGISNQIMADVTINADQSFTIINVVTTLTVRDFSIPTKYMTDTRLNKNDPIVNIFSGYGLLIDGSNNPVDMAVLQFNGHDRFDMREGTYFNNVQPEQAHTNTPKDGINCYSFALFPEQHQPSGTANFSRIDNSQLIVTFLDSTQTSTNPNLQFFNGLNQTFNIVSNYNIFRVFSGLSGLAYQ